VIERDADGSQLGWLTPCIRTPQEFIATFAQEEQFLETWIDRLKKSKSTCNIEVKHLVSLLGPESKSLAVHTPPGTRLSTIQLPATMNRDETFAFKLTAPPGPKVPPIACMIESIPPPAAVPTVPHLFCLNSKAESLAIR